MIKSITLEGFRGATKRASLTFHEGKKLSFILGENGSGKSTIADALDAVFNASCGSLEDRSLGSGRKSRFLPSLQLSAANVAIEVQTSDGATHSAALGTKGITQEVPASAPHLHVLRRGKLSALVEEQDGERYDRLRPFFEISCVESGEASLAELLRDVTRDFDLAARAFGQASESLDQIWQRERRPGDSDANAPDWASTRAQSDISALRSAKDQLAEVIRLIDEGAGARAAYGTAARLAKEAKEALRSAQDKAAESLLENSKHSVELIQLLQKAKAVLAPPADPRHCPVCGQDVEPAHLRRRIDRQIAAMDQVRSAADHLETCRAQVTSTSGAISVHAEALRNCADQVAILIRASDLPELAKYKGLPELESAPNGGAQQKQDFHLLKTLGDDRAAHHTRFEDLSLRIALHETIVQQLAAYTESEARVKDLEAKKALIEPIVATVREERIMFCQEVLNDVAAECKRIYEAIHPGEQLNLDALTIDPTKKGSVRQTATFAGRRDLPPGAYFSDSHLDTLGLALFVSIAKRKVATTPAILVLDDIFTTVDLAHMDRVLKTLVEESEHFDHIIVTTNIRRWFESARMHQAGHDIIELHELGPWDFAYGIRCFKTEAAFTEIQRLLDPAIKTDRQAVASKCGILLESMLDHLARKYRCAIPKSPNDENTLGELLDGTAKLLKSMTVQQGAWEDGRKGHWVETNGTENVAPAFERLKAISWIRNEVGAHFNRQGLDLQEADVRTFAQATLSLAELFLCSACRSLPVSQKPNWWKCACGLKRTHPVVKPA